MHWLMRRNIDVIGTTNLIAKSSTHVGSCPILPAMLGFNNKNQRMMVKLTIQNELSRNIRVKA